MKKQVVFFVLGACALSCTMFPSCSGESGDMQKKLDSLETLYSQRDGDYNRLNEYLTVIADGLDSISEQENLLLSNNIPGESPYPNREAIRQNLDVLKQLLSRQKARLAELESSLENEKGDVKRLKGIIYTLRLQLEEKDAEIAQMRIDIDNKNKSIEQFVAQTKELKQQNREQEWVIESQGETVRQQEEIIETQDNMLNEGFIKIGTKKELSAAGLLDKGNLFKKKKVNYSGVDPRLFQAVDIRHATEIPLPTTKVKILTPMPKESYVVTSEGGSPVLRILDPPKFWGVSSYLIVQTN